MVVNFKENIFLGKLYYVKKTKKCDKNNKRDR